MTDDDPPLAWKIKKPFAWIPASTHNAGSAEFYKRQKARIADAEKARANVTPLKRKTK